MIKDKWYLIRISKENIKLIINKKKKKNDGEPHTGHTQNADKNINNINNKKIN